MRPPEEIAAACEAWAQYHLDATDGLGNAEYKTFCEAAEALRRLHQEYLGCRDRGDYLIYRDEYEELLAAKADRDALLAVARVLRRLRQWDHLDTAGDGLYWKREIDAALAALPEHLRRQVDS
jgi:hypothetical protein